MELLFQILAAKRPYGDPYEKQFVQEVIIERLEAKGHHVIKSGPMENLIVIIPSDETGNVNKVLFSCHTDTVHHTGGPNKVIIDTNLGVCYTDDKGHECLGADDGTGVWILLKMIDAGVAGTYIFHRGEERGCIGSNWMSSDPATQEFLRKHDYAIAFDRRDMDDIITHQRSRRCCSEEFAKALAAALNAEDEDFKYKPDPTGIYTDTANYDNLIRECTNISVGYSGAHGAGEMQDLDHAKKLLAACLKIKWTALPAVRDPKRENSWGGSGRWSRQEGSGSSTSDNYGATGRTTTGYDPNATVSSSSSMPTSLQGMMRMLAMRYVDSAGKQKLTTEASRLLKDPPFSLREMLQSGISGENGIEGLDDYLMAMIKYAPEMALITLRTALVSYQYYAVTLSRDNVRDAGILGYNPTRSNYLVDNYEAGLFGILFPKEKTEQPPPTPPYRAEELDPERQKIVDMRKKRKEAKKKAKAEKKGKVKGRQFTHGRKPGTLAELKSTNDPVDPPRATIINLPVLSGPTVKNVTQ
jgi:hypothetical protein